MNKMLSTVALLAITGNVLMAGGDIAPVEPVMTEEVVSDGWEYAAGIYFWLPDMGGETAEGDDIDYKLNDILDDLNMMFMGDIAVQKGKWGFQTDFIYMNLGRKVAQDQVSVKLKAVVVTPTVSYRVMESGPWDFDVLAGGRYAYLDGNLRIDPALVDADASISIWNGIVGFQGNYTIDETWYMPFYADVGTGDTDLTWQASVGVGYRTGNWDLIANYRYLDFKFDDGDEGGKALNELDIIGPQIGFKYRF